MESSVLKSNVWRALYLEHQKSIPRGDYEKINSAAIPPSLSGQIQLTNHGPVLVDLLEDTEDGCLTSHGIRWLIKHFHCRSSPTVIPRSSLIDRLIELTERFWKHQLSILKS